MTAFFLCLGLGLFFIFLGAATLPRWKGAGVPLLALGILLAVLGAMTL